MLCVQLIASYGELTVRACEVSSAARVSVAHYGLDGELGNAHSEVNTAHDGLCGERGSSVGELFCG